MSIRVMALVWKTQLTSTGKLVLLYYADRASDDGTDIFPSVATVQKATSLSERCVRKITKGLHQTGYLISAGWSRYHTKNYRINLEKLINENISIEDQGCSTCTPEVHQMPETGERGAPKPSVAVHKPSFSNKRKNKTSYIDQYMLIIDEEMKKLLNKATIYNKENSNER